MTECKKEKSYLHYQRLLAQSERTCQTLVVEPRTVSQRCRPEKQILIDSPQNAHTFFLLVIYSLTKVSDAAKYRTFHCPVTLNVIKPG